MQQKGYQACRSAMLQGSETCGPNNPELQQPQGNDRVMINWIYGTKPKNKAPSASLLKKLGTEDITSVLYSGDSDSAAMYIGPCPVSNRSSTFRFQALDRRKAVGRHGPNEQRLMSVIVACLALTRKTEMPGEPVFDIAWCCQPRRMNII